MNRFVISFIAVICLVACSIKEIASDYSESENSLKVTVAAVVPEAGALSKTTFESERLCWTGDETMDVLIGNTGSTEPDKAQASTLHIDPTTVLFHGNIDLGAFSESDIRAITVPGGKGAWVGYSNDRFTARIPLKVDQVQYKDGQMNGEYFPLYAPITEDIRLSSKLVDGSYKFTDVQLKWACSAIRFNIYGTHPELNQDEHLKSVRVSLAEFPECIEIDLESDKMKHGIGNDEITVTLVEEAVLAGRTAENGIKLFMAIYPYQTEIHSVAITTDKAVYQFRNESGVLKTIQGEDLRGNVYQFGLNLSKFERVALPVADLLDISFLSDGTAVDVSASQMKVLYYSGNSHTNYYNEDLKKHIAHFSNPFNTAITKGFYKIDYQGNTEYCNRIADGHTLETLFKVDQTASGEYEIKPFSSMEGGGTGFLITKPKANGGDITFLPNVTTNGNSNWIWTQSGVTPQPGMYYHVVGVWNKDEGKSYIYVNGELKGTQDAVGEFKFPSTDRNWFCIGGDPSKVSTANCGFKGDVAMARMYDAPLDQKEVQLLWDIVKDIEKYNPEVIDINNVEMLPSATVKPGCTMYIYGDGFKKGDVIKLGTGTGIPCETNLGEGCLKVTIPDGLTSGQSNVVLSRGATSLSIGSVDLTVSTSIFPARNSGIVAHRGYHPGNVAENSLASLIEAQKVGVFGSEFDVYVTTDDVVVLYHDAKLSDGRRIDACTYEEIKDYTLGNGEKLPTFEQYLEQAKKYPDVKLVCEIKTHENATKNLRAVNACAAAVDSHNIADQIVWIAFDYTICKNLASLYPDAMVQYLNGDKAPSIVYADGINGIDYRDTKLKDEWITEAHELGMAVNVWSINDRSDMLKFIAKGVDFITTDESEIGLELVGRPYITE